MRLNFIIMMFGDPTNLFVAVTENYGFLCETETYVIENKTNFRRVIAVKTYFSFFQL